MHSADTQQFAFQCTGSPVAHANIYKFIRNGGGLCELGFFINGGDATINPHFDLCSKEITLVGSWVYTLRDYATTFDFLKRAKGIGLPMDEADHSRIPVRGDQRSSQNKSCNGRSEDRYYQQIVTAIPEKEKDMAEAVGMLEVFGLATAFAAADAGCKAGNVWLENFDKNKPANADELPVPLIVMIKFRGSVSDVQAALEAAKAKAEQLAGVVNEYEIARPTEDTEKMLKISAFDKGTPHKINKEEIEEFRRIKKWHSRH